jgi:hypothetical protein
MAVITQKLYGGYASTNSVGSIYTVPWGKTVILKSLTICNTSATKQMFSVELEGIDFARLHDIEPGQTLVIPVLDQVMKASESVLVFCPTANALSVRLSGKVTDRTDMLTARMKVNTTDTTVIPAGKMIVKSIVICTLSTSQIDFYMKLGSDYVIYGKALKPLDTLFIPFLDQVLDNESIVCRVSNMSTSVTVHVNALVVN